MKASTVIAVAAGLTAYTVSAQLDQIPECALSCAITSLGSTGCGTTDIACICSNTAFVTSLVPCVQGACSAADFGATVQAATALCQSAGVTLNIPTGGGSSSAAPSSTTAAPTDTTSVTVSVPVTSTSVTVVVPPVNTTLTEAPVPEPTGGNTTTTAVTPPAPSGTDGSSASRNAVALGGLGALVAFVAALL